MKQQCKMIGMLVAMERPLEVVANTNPAIAPKGGSPLARIESKKRIKKNRIHK